MQVSARDSIIDAAEAVFAEKGFSGTSMNAISKAAGVSKSLLYHHFQSKRLLWEEVVSCLVSRSALHEKIRATVSMLMDLDLDEVRSRSGHRGYFDFLKKNPGFVRMLAWLNAERSFPMSGPPMGLVSEVTTNLRTLQERGVFRKDVDARMFVVFFMAICEFWFVSADRVTEWFGGVPPDDGDADEYIAAAGKVLFTGMRGGSG